MIARKRILVGVPLLFALMLFVSGCGGNRATARVSGTVTYKGQPLKGGTVSFLPSDGGAYTAAIAEDGTYATTNVTTGEMTVTVSTSHLNPKAEKQEYGAGKSGKKAPAGGRVPSKAMVAKEKSGIAKQNDQMAKALGLKINPGAAEQAGRYTPIPAKYSKIDESPLKAKISSGDNKFDFDLTD